MKLKIAQYLRRIADRLAPPPAATKQILYPDGRVCSLKKFRGQRIYPVEEWQHREQRFGASAWADIARNNLCEDIAMSLLEQLEDGGMVKYDTERYFDEVDTRITVSLFLKS